MPKDKVDMYKIMRDTASPDEAIEWNNTELKSLKRKQFRYSHKSNDFRNGFNEILDRETAYKENAKVKDKASRLLKDPIKAHKFMTAPQDDCDGELENILTKIQKSNVSKKTELLKKASYVIPYSKPLMSESERKNLANEIDEIRFKVMMTPEPDPDLSKGISGLLNGKKLK